MTTGSLTVLFEDPFWIGLFEMIDQQGLRACKVTFGAEPTDKEVIRLPHVQILRRAKRRSRALSRTDG